VQHRNPICVQEQYY